MKKVIFSLLFILLTIPIVSASLSLSEVSSYVEDYNEGEINSAQLIVYLEYLQSKMYESLDKEGKKAFTLDEIETVFGKAINDEKIEEFEKVFYTSDFAVVFSAYPFYRYDEEYYEKRESESEDYYSIGYYLRPLQGSSGSSDLVTGIKKFVNDLDSMVDTEDFSKFEELKAYLSGLRQQISQVDNCEEIAKEVGCHFGTAWNAKEKYIRKQNEE